MNSELSEMTRSLQNKIVRCATSLDIFIDTFYLANSPEGSPKMSVFLGTWPSRRSIVTICPL